MADLVREGVISWLDTRTDGGLRLEGKAMSADKPRLPIAPPRVFLCYARADNKDVAEGRGWRERLMAHLRPYEKQGRFSVFFDGRIQTGADWDEEIQREVRACDIAVLLISTGFLGSDYILDKELPELLRRRDEDSVKLIPLLLSPCNWDDNVTIQFCDSKGRSRELRLSSLQDSIDKPLSLLDGGAQEEAMRKVAKEIGQQALVIAERRSREVVPPVREDRPSPPEPPLSDSPPAQELRATDPVVELVQAVADRPRDEPLDRHVPDSPPGSRLAERLETLRRVLQVGWGTFVGILIPLLVVGAIAYNAVFGPDTSIIVQDLEWEPRNPKPGVPVVFTATFAGTYTVRDFSGGYWPRKRDIEGERMARTFTEKWLIGSFTTNRHRVEVLVSQEPIRSHFTNSFSEVGSYTVRFSLDVVREDCRNEIVRTIVVAN